MARALVVGLSYNKEKHLPQARRRAYAWSIKKVGIGRVHNSIATFKS